jgi:hypothetical protein
VKLAEAAPDLHDASVHLLAAFTASDERHEGEDEREEAEVLRHGSFV